MLEYKLTLNGQNGDTVWSYDPHSSTMLDEEGIPVSLEHLGYAPDPTSFRTVPVNTPEAPLGKQKIRVLKIQMGLKCNYSCSYCNQALHAAFHGANIDHVEKFLENLPNWLDNIPERVEFWGGEPLVYWKHLQVLVERLRPTFPDAHFNIITNGSLLTDEIVDFFVKHDMGVNISHDGPAQNQRSPEDILDDPEKARLLRRLHREGNMGIGTVLTRHNFSLHAVREHVEEKLGLPEFSLSMSTEEILLPYDEDGLSMIPQNEDEHFEARHTIFLEAVDGKTVPACNSVREKIEDIFSSLSTRRPWTALWQKCGMDRPDIIAVNTFGDVLTCQNVSPKGKHQIGSVDNLEEVALTSSWHFRSRSNCQTCPMVQVCKGSCMFLEDELFEAACDTSYTYNLAMFAAALFYITGGLVLTKIEGPDRRGGNSVTDVIDVKHFLEQIT